MKDFVGVQLLDEKVKEKLTTENIFKIMNQFITPLISKKERNFLEELQSFLIKEVKPLVDLNKELTNIQLVTGQTDQEVAKLGVGYNNLAKEMGATTLEVTKGSLEYIRQGKTAEETQTLLKNTMMVAKLGSDFIRILCRPLATPLKIKWPFSSEKTT